MSFKTHRIGALIGVGATDDVHTALDPDTGAIIAVKILRTLVADPDDPVVADLLREIGLLSRLDHLNIVRYLGSDTSEDTKRVNIYMEYMSGGSLQHVVRRFGPLPERTIRVYLSDALQGLAYIHSEGIVHRDIKPANLLVGSDGKVKLSDFGCAKAITASCSVTNSTAVLGTPVYMAPEAVTGRAGKPADVWSLACTAVELNTGVHPYADRRFDHPLQLMFFISQGGRPELPQQCTDAFREFLQMCFIPDPAERATVDALLMTKFMQCPAEEIPDVLPGVSAADDMEETDWVYGSARNGNDDDEVAELSMPTKLSLTGSDQSFTESCGRFKWAPVSMQKFDLTSSPPEPLPRMALHSAVAFTPSLVILYGGVHDVRTMGVRSSVIALNPQTGHWSERTLTTPTASTPGARHSHAAVRFGSYMLMFGGQGTGPFQLFNCVWLLNVCDNDRSDVDLGTYAVWSLVVDVVGDIPAPTKAHAMAITADERIVYVFGGETGSRCSSKTLYSFNPHERVWRQLQESLMAGIGPRKRVLSSMVVVGEFLYIAGGYHRRAGRCDVFRFDLKSSTWSEVCARVKFSDNLAVGLLPSCNEVGGGTEDLPVPVFLSGDDVFVMTPGGACLRVPALLGNDASTSQCYLRGSALCSTPQQLVVSGGLLGFPTKPSSKPLVSNHCVSLVVDAEASSMDHRYRRVLIPMDVWRNVMMFLDIVSMHFVSSTCRALNEMFLRDFMGDMSHVEAPTPGQPSSVFLRSNLHLNKAHSRAIARVLHDRRLARLPSSPVISARFDNFNSNTLVRSVVYDERLIFFDRGYRSLQLYNLNQYWAGPEPKKIPLTTPKRESLTNGAGRGVAAAARGRPSVSTLTSVRAPASRTVNHEVYVPTECLSLNVGDDGVGVVGTRDRIVVAFDSDDGSVEGIGHGHTAVPWVVRITADFVFSAGYDLKIKVWSRNKAAAAVGERMKECVTFASHVDVPVVMTVDKGVHSRSQSGLIASCSIGTPSPHQQSTCMIHTLEEGGSLVHNFDMAGQATSVSFLDANLIAVTSGRTIPLFDLRVPSPSPVCTYDAFPSARTNNLSVIAKTLPTSKWGPYSMLVMGSWGPVNPRCSMPHILDLRVPSAPNPIRFADASQPSDSNTVGVENFDVYTAMDGTTYVVTGHNTGDVQMHVLTSTAMRPWGPPLSASTSSNTGCGKVENLSWRNGRVTWSVANRVHIADLVRQPTPTEPTAKSGPSLLQRRQVVKKLRQ